MLPLHDEPAPHETTPRERRCLDLVPRACGEPFPAGLALKRVDPLLQLDDFVVVLKDFELEFVFMRGKIRG
jgi:hypothetical protein